MILRLYIHVFVVFYYTFPYNINKNSYICKLSFQQHYDMKDFIKNVGATIVGIFLFGIIIGIFGVMSLVGMVASGQATKNVKENSVLVLKLQGDLQEQAQDDVLGQLTGNTFNSLGMDAISSAIKKAKANKDIKGIYLETGILGADVAQLQELRDQLVNFKKSGKWIVAYSDNYTQGCYYLATAADKVYINPEGSINWHGIGSQPMFVKDLLAKFGVKMQVIKVGKYKSATEMFTEEKMSDANREQTQRYIQSLWDNMCKAVSKSRNISVAKLNDLADNGVFVANGKMLLAEKMVDGVKYADEMKAEVKKLLKLDADKKISQLSIADMATVKEEGNDGDDEIAVYYAYGDIVDSPAAGSLFSNSHAIVGNDVCKDLEELANDDDVKAVVIRINSGGGSAYASEQMWHQIDLLKKKKPVVISMGGMAASGGYYMSCNANYIFAEPTTLTGSIGIFGVIPNFSDLATNKLGLKFDEVKTNRNALFGSQARMMNEEELTFLQSAITRGYHLFRQRVADGRKMTVDQVEQIAQGHVFTGEDALKIKLVDELGGLDKAVAKAAALAKTKSYYTQGYPAPLEFFDQLLQESTDNGSYLDGKLKTSLGTLYEPMKMVNNITTMDRIQARMPWWLNINN